MRATFGRSCARPPRLSAFGFSAAFFLRSDVTFAAATLALSASIRSTAGAGSSVGSGDGDLLAAQLGLEQRPQVAAVLARQLVGSKSAARPCDDLACKLELGLLHLGLLHGLVDLGLRVDVLDEVERLEHETLAPRAHEAERLAPGADETADRRDAGLLHRLEQQLVRAALRRCRAGDEEVGAVDPDRIDVLERDEALDVDRARVVVRARGPRAPPPRRRRTGPSRPPSP